MEKRRKGRMKEKKEREERRKGKRKGKEKFSHTKIQLMRKERKDEKKSIR